MSDDPDSLQRRFEAAVSEQLRSNAVGLKEVEKQLQTLSSDVRVMDNSLLHLRADLKEGEQVVAELKFRQRIESLESSRSAMRGALVAMSTIWAISSAIFGWVISHGK